MVFTKCFSFALWPENVTLFGSPIISIELILFMLAVWQEFRKYRKQQRSKAAVRVLNLLNSLVDDIDAIRLNPDYYGYEGYYPWIIPEVGSKVDSIPFFKERPSRLIFNLTGKLKKDLGEPISEIGGKEAKELDAILSAFYVAAHSMGNTIAEKVKENSVIFSAEDISNCIDKSWNKIEDVKKKFEDILIPIIEGECFICKISKWIFIAALIFGMLFFFA